MATLLVLHIQRDKIMKTRDLVVIAMMAAILFVAQVALSFIPNIELVTLLIMIYTLVMGRKTIFAIYVFALLEGLFYGFGIWWIMYLYVWTILYFVVSIFGKQEGVLGWGLIGGFFGLFFGTLCSIPYFFIGGIGAGLAWWGAGLLYDVLHGVGNFVVILCLFKPIYNVIKKLYAAGSS